MISRVIFLWAISLAAHAQMAQSDAFASGQGAAGGVEAAMGNISATTGGQVIQSYGAPTPQSSFYTGSQSPIAGIMDAGNQKIGDCAAGNNGNTAEQQQHCEAVRAMSQAVATPNPYTVTVNDPLIQLGRPVSDNPSAILGNINASYTGCQSQTITQPDAFTQETCEQYLSPETNVCSIPRVVEVMASHKYQCLNAPSKINNYTCNRTLSVQVDVTQSCVPGSWIDAGTAYRNGADQMKVWIYCDPNRNDGMQHVRIRAFGGNGDCDGGGQNHTFPLAAGPTQNVDTLHPHWNGNCSSLEARYTPAGCAGNTCNAQVEFGGYQCVLDPDTWNCSYEFTPWWTINAAWSKPRLIYTVHPDVWDNGCSNLESRAQ